MVTLHSGKQIIIDNKRIASKEEAVAISQEEAFKKYTDLPGVKEA